MNDWDGKERRQDDIRERLGIVEHSSKLNADLGHENHLALEGLFKNISELKLSVGDEIRLGHREIVKILVDHEEKRTKECTDCKTEISTLRTGMKYLDRWLAGLSTATAAITAAITGWLVHKGNP